MKLILILLLIVPVLGFNQINKETGLAEFTEVKQVDGLSKAKIYDILRDFVYSNYNNGKHVIQIEDKESGKIMIKAITKTLSYKNMGQIIESGHFKYTLTLSVKDGRYKYLFEDIYFEKTGKNPFTSGSNFAEEYPVLWGNMSKNWKQKIWDDFKSQAEQEISLIIASIETNINSKKTNSDDW